MSLNDRNTTLSGSRGVDMYPGVSNPTQSSRNSDALASNFVNDPTSAEAGAGAGAGFTGGRDAERDLKQVSGVVEGRPGIIESTHIDPLNEQSSRDDSWANHRNTSSGVGTAAMSAFGTATSAVSSAAGMAADAARMAYGAAVGDEDTRKAGRESLWGKDK